MSFCCIKLHFGSPATEQASKFVSKYFTATSFTDLLSGTLDDGILIVEFQK